MTFKPTIHHIVNGQSVCGQGSIGYTDFHKVSSSPNACSVCTTKKEELMFQLSKQEVGDLLISCSILKEFTSKRRHFRGRKEINDVYKQMELILNKFVK